MEFCDRTGTPHSILLGRIQQPGEPYFLPEDRAKLLALWAWQAEHCPSCGQRRSEWYDENGIELRDPPFEVAETVCPPCAWLESYEAENPKKDRIEGSKLYLKRLDDDEEPAE